ncbi:MAG: serine/threonine-protein phosphatase [Candidatus Omnitrophica bacterium]|nr:serine/threonine-protein phosphatase [Candidatus Omnitrophota bacterium]
MKKIPAVYRDEFSKQYIDLIKSRVQLAALLFIATFFIGSTATVLILNENFTRQLGIAWTLTVCVSITTIVLSARAATLRAAVLSATSFIVMALSIMTWYHASLSAPPFNVAMVYIFMLFGFSLMFPWFPHEVFGVLILHLGAYGVFLAHTKTYLYKNSTATTSLPDYIQGLVVMVLGFCVCYIVTKRERERDIESFMRLKDIEEKSNQMKKELELATRIHGRLVPRSTSTDLADIAVTYLPVSYMGGDYAKFHFVDKNKLIFIICDVTGHGVSAALLVNAFNGEFERLAKDARNPGELLKEIDRFILKDFAETGMYLTAFCGLLDYMTRKFSYSSYGHPPQYVYRSADSKLNRIMPQAGWMGLPIEDENIYENEMPFDKGDQILLFTDGIVEARNNLKEEYGAEKLEAFLDKNQGLQTDVFNQNLIDELNLFTGKIFNDDIFILNIRVK